MGARGEDRTTGRALSLGWDEESSPAAPDTLGGSAVAGPGPTGDEEAAPASGPYGPSRLSRRSRRLIAVCTVLVLVAGMLIALPRLLGAVDGPAQVAGEFLQAVIDGDLETVRAHSQDASDAGAAALTEEVLAGAEDRLDSFEIRHVEIGAGTATVTAELRSGSERGEGTFTLTSSDAGAFSPTVWELAPVVLPELRIDLTVGVQEVEIGGVVFPVQEIMIERETFEPQVAVQLLPGTYEVSLPQVPPWVQAPRQALEVPATFGSVTTRAHELPLALDEDGRAEVQRQVDAALEECATRTSSAPDGCPFAVPDPAEGGAAAEETPPVADQGTWTFAREPGIETIPINAFLWMVGAGGTAEFAPADGADPIEVTFSTHGMANITGQGVLEVHLEEPGNVPFGYCVDAETGALTGVIRVEEPDQGADPECREGPE